MNDENKAFNWGVFLLILFVVVSVMLGHFNRRQNDKLYAAGQNLKKTQQNIAAAEAEFAEIDNLDELLNDVQPNAEFVGFDKAVSIKDLKTKK